MSPEHRLCSALRQSLARELAKPRPNIDRWARNTAHRLLRPKRKLPLDTVDQALWNLRHILT